MGVRGLVLIGLGALLLFSAMAPAFADNDWRWQERQAWRDHERRKREWREHEWREHEWREHAWHERR